MHSEHSDVLLVRGKHLIRLVHMDPQAYVDIVSYKFVQCMLVKVCTESFTIIYIFGTQS